MYIGNLTPTDRGGHKQHSVVDGNVRLCPIIEKVVDEILQVHNVLFSRTCKERMLRVG